MSRRRRLWPLLAVAFLLVPLVEISVIVQVGQQIGALPTIALLVLDSLAGAWLVRREGRRAWTALRTALAQGRLPHRELADGILVLIGGTLMLTPGFVTDVVAALMLVPFTRPPFRRVLAGFVGARLVGAPGTTTGPRQRPGGVGGDVVPGEVVDPDA